jgi:hypothetical protein
MRSEKGLGNVFPIAVELLEIYEKSLALLEEACQRRDILADTVDKAVHE